jgi:hypothetical protein
VVGFLGVTIRQGAWFLLVALLAAACGDNGASSRRNGGKEAAPASLATVESSPKETVPSALDDAEQAGLPKPLVDPAQIVSGGPPPDGIPPIDKPRFHPVGDVNFLHDSEPVLSLRIGDDARAYPVQIMIWHEIVNDVVGGVPVTVTYCPLCNSAVAYDRRVGERILDFGTSGRLYRSALVMYDRQTESLWSHFTGQAVAGVLTGINLKLHPVATVSWADWRMSHPTGHVLSRVTGHRRDYGRNPYPGYDDVSTSPFLFEGKVDDRLAAKTKVIGLRDGDASVAVLHDELVKRRTIDVTLAGRRLVVWAKRGTTSALDASSLAEGREVGATGVFVPAADGRELHFQAAGDAFRDRETGSTWDVLGRATAGPLAGQSLGPVEHVDTFWFAWAAFRPDTTIVPASNGD